jgi:uncharacterized ion transporter superfamily protein YfcC
MNVIIVILFIIIIALCFLFILTIGNHEERIKKVEETAVKDRIDIADHLNELLKNKR